MFAPQIDTASPAAKIFLLAPLPSNSPVQPSLSPSPSTPTAPNNSQPGGASLEESDPGYR